MDISNHVHVYQRLINRSKLMDLAQDVLIVLDASGVVLDVNQAAADLHGTTVDELIGSNCVDLLHPDSMGHMMKVSGDLLLAGVDGVATMILKTLVNNGETIHLELRVSFSQQDQQFYVVERDVTAHYQRTCELQALSEQLRVLASTDPLTGIANRTSFEQRLTEAEVLDEDAWLVIIDVDQFKSINDNYGHVAGDSVLRSIATRVAEELNSNELFARIGGDEFALILPASHEVDAHDRMRCVEAAVLSAVTLDDGNVLHVSCSIGSSRRVMGEATSDWLRRADAAMYTHKQSRQHRALAS